ncbi:MAG: glycosyltransferase [Candidatus Doudnabacteria bacterium]|nr:glycosyltransferase [Candidatus Doudnabacteria bacterium]
MKILFCGLKYEYGKPSAGLSFEYQNFYQVLNSMPGIDCSLFAVDEKMLEGGREAMNALLIKEVELTSPDLLFCFLFTDEIKQKTIEHITNRTKTKTFNWFADDHWRLPIYSRYWAPLFTMVGTTDSRAPARYAAYGIKNVVKTQWAANVSLFRHVGELENRGIGSCDITFVGKNYGKRGKYISGLKSTGLPARGFGKGWDGGIVSQQTMLEIFSQSKINLNFTESYFTWTNQLAKLLFKKNRGRWALSFHPLDQLRSLAGARRRQIKGRTFEIPACGGFLLSGDADDIGNYYVDGKEAVIFKNEAELFEKCRYYLSHDAERQAIARAGHERTLRDNTYEKRFTEIFRALGLM